MPRVPTLHQTSAHAIIRALCSKSDVDIHYFFDMLPIPQSLKVKLENTCTSDIINKVINRILACTVWLEVEGNYHEERIRLYREMLEDTLDALLPYSLWMHGL